MVTFVRAQQRRGARHVCVVHGKGLHSESGVSVLRDHVVTALTEGGATPFEDVRGEIALDVRLPAPSFPPIREARRGGGSQDAVQLLVEEYGAEVNARTHGGYGETALHIAEQRLEQNHPVLEYLRSLGALSIGPEL